MVAVRTLSVWEDIVKALRPARRPRTCMFAFVLLIVAALLPGRAGAGTVPNLDDNRHAFDGPAIAALLNFVVPAVCLPVVCKVQVGARVVAQPHIVNIFWDDHWDADNPDSPTQAQVDSVVQGVASSEFLDPAAQYGVGRGSLDSVHGPSTLCLTMRPTGPDGQPASRTNPGTLNVASVIAWMTCELENSPFTAVPPPDDNTIYALMLPEGVTMPGSPGADCTNVVAFHMFSLLLMPNTDADLLLGTALKLVGYPIIVMPAQCMLALDAAGIDSAGTLNNWSKYFSHELVEAALDPVPPTGWIDDSWAPDLSPWTSKGEPGDICQQGSQYIGRDGNPVITAPVRMAGGALVERYWSNAANECVPTGDTTAPVITPTVTGTLGLGGWYVSDVTVKWDVSDPESTATPGAGCADTTIAADTAGTTLTCTAASAGGSGTQSITIKRDATPPTITHEVVPGAPDGSNLWYVSAPTVTFSCSDSLSGLASCQADGAPRGFGAHTSSATLGEAAAAQSVEAAATDFAGNVGHDSTGGLLVDLSAPTITAGTDRSPNADGWWNAAVTVTFRCADAISGVASCPATQTFGEGLEQSASGTTRDIAGRSANVTLAQIDVDATPPIVTFSGNGGSYTVDQTVQITCSASDALSGIATSTCADLTGPAWSFGVGTTISSASALDKAGNTGTGSTSFTVVVTAASLDNLIRRFFGSDQTGANGLIAKVAGIPGSTNGGKLGAFDNQVDAKTGNPLTAAQAALLKQLAAAL